MTAAIRQGEDYPNVHAVLIARHGRLVYEQYFEGEDLRYRGDQRERVSITFHPDTLHDSRSVGKSITSALVGIAVGSGAIASLDTPLVAFFPEHADLVTPEKSRITLRHALSMSAGLDWNENDVPYTDPTNHEEQMSLVADPAEFVLARPVTSEPGTVWAYSGGMTVLLGMVIARTTGRPFGTFAREALLEPLGIAAVEWNGPRAWSDTPEFRWSSAEPWARASNPAGSVWMRPRDFLKFGALYLDDGRWNGRQILPEGWAAESTQPLFPLGNEESDEYGEFGYGYHWWHNRYPTPEGDIVAHAAVGNGEQRIYVVPSLDMVVVHLAGRYNEDGEWMSERLLLDFVFPAAQRGASEAIACREAAEIRRAHTIPGL